MEKQFAKEKAEAAENDGMIYCPLVDRMVCFCSCGPHLLCPEHSLVRRTATGAKRDASVSQL